MTETGKTVEDRVRERAHALWEKHGRAHGRADEHWRQARSEAEAEESEPGNDDLEFLARKTARPARSSSP